MPPDVLSLERATLTAVPAPRNGFDGPFVLRAFVGGTGRANAASSLDPAPDAALPERVARIEARYAALGLPVRFRSTPLDPPGLVELLASRGYVAKDETAVLVAPIGTIAVPDAAAESRSAPDADWMAVTATAEHQGPRRREEKQGTAPLLTVPGAWITLRENGAAMAVASVVAAGPLAGYFDLAVRPEFRRRGLAARAVRAAADWARGQGAEWLFCQVAAANIASLALNAGLGMREAYRYTYWVRPQDGTAPLKFG
ncbi:GNAT family N-acetyltransferase [Roseomonas terrae]|jgi:GNAT superfamily N-acetyltransferase|uniref:GNAT family N-acetyltransferase n=1 Tax=Neoroseomonas terrae TaxID=424799 RepID=A0ABS5EDP8_9PROT|nr:GNAT family N-acetyltransferase [Neoroseomonas terrae]MBR0649136.1 GNAT family N-acetyltransferase [Neoroseomonas terrae]